MPRTVLFYTHGFAGGGAEIVFSRLARAFATAGHRAILIADHEDGAVPAGVETMVLGADHRAGVRALATLLRDEKPDASFSALGAQNLKHLAAAVLAGRRAHCVLGYHGFPEAEPKHLSQIAFRMTPITTRLAARTICVSDTLLDHVRRRLHGSPDRTLRIYNPVPAVARPPREKGGILSRPPLVLACGRFVEGKRFPALVEAFADVTPRNAHLAILGEGPERAAIEEAVTRCGLGGRVHLPGQVDPATWYARARCVAIASSSESFGLTAAEALAHGLPVVATDCGGPPELLEHGRFGTIVPIGDRAAMTRAITDLLADPGDPAPRLIRAGDFAEATILARYAAVVDALSG